MVNNSWELGKGMSKLRRGACVAGIQWTPGQIEALPVLFGNGKAKNSVVAGMFSFSASSFLLVMTSKAGQLSLELFSPSG